MKCVKSIKFLREFVKTKFVKWSIFNPNFAILRENPNFPLAFRECVKAKKICVIAWLGTPPCNGGASYIGVHVWVNVFLPFSTTKRSRVAPWLLCKYFCRSSESKKQSVSVPKNQEEKKDQSKLIILIIIPYSIKFSRPFYFRAFCPLKCLFKIYPVASRHVNMIWNVCQNIKRIEIFGGKATKKWWVYVENLVRRKRCKILLPIMTLAIVPYARQTSRFLHFKWQDVTVDRTTCRET